MIVFTIVGVLVFWLVMFQTGYALGMFLHIGLPLYLLGREADKCIAAITACLPPRTVAP